MKKHLYSLVTLLLLLQIIKNQNSLQTTISFTICEEDSRHIDINCESQEELNTCGMFKDGSYQNFYNPCQACQNENIIGYSNQECKTEQIKQKTQCDEINFISGPCIEIYQPVCATMENGNIKTFSNECHACNNSAISFIQGACPDEQKQVKKCPNERPDACTFEYVLGGFCGIFFKQNQNLRAQNMKSGYSNECQVCSDTQVEYYIQGDCNDLIDPKISNQEDLNTYCTDIPDNCDTQYDPVCGQMQNQQYQDFGNGCESCMAGAISYKKGECKDDSYKIKCPPLDQRQKQCTEQFEVGGYCGIFFEGYTNQNGESQQSNYGTQCQVCADTNVEYYYKGSCNKDNASILNQLNSVILITLILFLMQ